MVLKAKKNISGPLDTGTQVHTQYRHRYRYSIDKATQVQKKYRHRYTGIQVHTQIHRYINKYTGTYTNTQ